MIRVFKQRKFGIEDRFLVEIGWHYGLKKLFVEIYDSENHDVTESHHTTLKDAFGSIRLWIAKQKDPNVKMVTEIIDRALKPYDGIFSIWEEIPSPNSVQTGIYYSKINDGIVDRLPLGPLTLSAYTNKR